MTKSPSARRGRRGLSVPKRSRSASSCSSTSSSVTSASSTVDLDALVVGQLDLGADVDLGGEGERLAVVEVGDVDLGLAERLEVVLLRRPRRRAAAAPR